MKSTSTKVLTATILAVSVLIGVTLYVKADRYEVQSDMEESLHIIQSDVATSMKASMKAHPRSFEYADDTLKNKKQYTYRRVRVKGDTTKVNKKNVAAKDVATKDEKPVQYNSHEMYEGYAVRSVDHTKTQVRDVATKKEEPQPMQKSTSTLQARDIRSTSDESTYQGYARRRLTQGESKESYAEEKHGDYARRSVDQKDTQVVAQEVQPATTNAEQSGEKYGEYAVRSVKNEAKNVATNTVSKYGYAVRRVPAQDVETKSFAELDNNVANESKEKHEGYEVRSVDNNETQVAQTESATRSHQSDVKHGGYAVRSVDQPKTSTATVKTSTSRTLASNTVTRTVRASRVKGGVPASTGIKVYNKRGYRVSDPASQVNKSVILMPVRGRCITGIVVQDNPGSNIVVVSPSGEQTTYRYGEIDALVNI